jgi:hypothetical protein
MKGWALDAAEDDGYGGLRERLAASNKLWWASLIVIIALAVIFISRSITSDRNPAVDNIVEDPVGVYTDGAHHDFAFAFAKLARRRGVAVEARFLSDRAFRFVMPCDASGDEIAFLSRAAATGIWRRFKVSPVIWAYIEDNKSPTPKLTAKTAWSPELGDFVVRFERAIGSE